MLTVQRFELQNFASYITFLVLFNMADVIFSCISHVKSIGRPMKLPDLESYRAVRKDVEATYNEPSDFYMLISTSPKMKSF